MKKLLIILTSLLTLFAGSVFSAESRMWRIQYMSSFDGGTPITITEMEFLYDADHAIASVTTGAGGSFALDTLVGNVTEHFPAGSTFDVSGSTGNDGTYTVDSVAFAAGITTVTVISTETVPDGTGDGSASPTVLVDASTTDLHAGACGWNCDSVLTNRRGTPSTVLFGVNTHRQVRVLFDNNNSTYFTTDETITAAGPWYVQYTFYLGNSVIRTTSPAFTRALPDIVSYSITVPVEEVLEKGPTSWVVEYFDGDSRTWVAADTQAGVNFSDGTDILSGTTVIAKKRTFTLN